MQKDAQWCATSHAFSVSSLADQAYFNALDDELIIRILSYLGSTVCLGAAPERRAALVPISSDCHANVGSQGPVIAPEFSLEFEKPLLAESSSVLLHTPMLHVDELSCSPGSRAGAAQNLSARRSRMLFDDPTPKPPCKLSNCSTSSLSSQHPLHIENLTLKASCGSVNTPVWMEAPESQAASMEAANATALQALACTNRRFRRLVMKHACTACTCTVPTLAEHAASSMGPCHLTHFDLHRCGALLHDHHLITLPKAHNLCSLDLSHCSSLTGNCLMYLKSMTALTHLNLSHCRDISPSGYVHLPNTLEHLNLSHMNEYRTPLFMHLTRLSGLKHLDLSSNDALITGLSGIENLNALTWLSIADCDLINDNDRFALASLMQLQSLDLGGTKISLCTLEFLAPLTKLSYICLDGCVKIRHRHVAWMREKSDAPAWDTAHVPTDFHTVDPSRIILTADCATPVASSSRKRACSSFRESSLSLGAYASSSSTFTGS